MLFFRSVAFIICLLVHADSFQHQGVSTTFKRSSNYFSDKLRIYRIIPHDVSICMKSCFEAKFNTSDGDDYSSSFAGGCVHDKENHVRFLDQSLEKSSGRGIFRRMNDVIWEEGSKTSEIESSNEPFFKKAQNITSFEHLDQNQRFGILSHGRQIDPIYNYGNRASLELFNYSIEALCQTPSRCSTVESLVDNRAELIRNIEIMGFGIISNAVRVTSHGELFVMKAIYVWNVYDDSGTRIGLAAWYDRSQVTYSIGPKLLDLIM